eukprot:1357267-Lingulodinium_polyedra.AAC.1
MVNPTPFSRASSATAADWLAKKLPNRNASASDWARTRPGSPSGRDTGLNALGPGGPRRSTDK